ncbi:hypothetical protein B7494_g7595 [Chlorociboria aeruginascens]|nr:hypothetical protein B7494_g7595 [Chlorociboria aeruginascens]
MAPQKPKVSISGVAEGQKIIGILTGEDVSAVERVDAFLSGSTPEEASLCGRAYHEEAKLFRVGELPSFEKTSNSSQQPRSLPERSSSLSPPNLSMRTV